MTSSEKNIGNSEQKKAKREYDSYQKAAISAMKNSVVSAGAGSGKTSVLSERFSRLVTEKNMNVDEILTLTFTKKATVEMSDRIYKTLKEKAPSQAANFYKANIKTLDSYCNGVAKMGCNFYGVAPDFSMDNDAIKEHVKAMALPFILENKDNEAIKSIVNLSSFDSIADSLFATPILKNSTVATPIDFDKKIEAQVEEIVQIWNKSVFKINDLMAEINANFRDFNGNKTSKSFVFMQKYFSDEAMENYPAPVEISKSDIYNENISAAESFFESISFPFQSVSGNGTEELAVLIKECKEKRDSLSPVFNYIYGFHYVKSLVPLLKIFQDKVNTYKRSSGILSFNDVSDMTVCILRDYPEIRKVEKMKYKAIMIDEFQDNNSTQRDMLFLLAEKPERMEKGIPSVDELCKEKLFFVGDEKQSIYRFRGADVSVFRALSKDFSEGNLNMTTNYRSHQALIAGFNTIFGGEAYPLFNQNGEALTTASGEKMPGVFYSINDPKSSSEDGFENEIPDYEPIYSPVTIPEFRLKEIEEAGKAGAANEIFAPRIHIAEYDKPEIVDPSIDFDEYEENFDIIEEEAEAVWVAEKIREITESDAALGKKYKPEDIAILFRNYSLQHIYERTLLNYGIPYATETTTGLFSDGPVNDIFAFLRLLAYPEDAMTFSKIIRSPWMNLSIDEMSEILLFNEKNNLLPFEAESFDFLSDSSNQRYKNAKVLFETLKISSHSEKLCETVTKLWYDSGYRYETMWNETAEMYGKMYDLIFELARKSDENNLSLAGFVDSVRKYEDLTEKLENMDIPLEQKNGVHIMTIHKSKGLEFPVVFVSGTHKSSGTDKNDQPVFASKEFGITVNTPKSPLCSASTKYSNYFYDKVKNRKKSEDQAELKRVAYVALTRAKEQLFVTRGKAISPQKKTDTIFFYLQPIFDCYRNSTAEVVPFDFEIIKPRLRHQISSPAGKKRKNTNAEKINLIQKIKEDKVYENASVIEEEQLSRIYINPSQLHEADDESYAKIVLSSGSDSSESSKSDSASQTSSAKEPKEYSRINEIILSTLPKYDTSTMEEVVPAFSHANFGTIAHAYLEGKINGEKPKFSNREIVGLEGKKKNLEEILAICEKMADTFEATELGKKAISSSWHKAEYSFKSRISVASSSGETKSKIIKGTIDLVFKNPDGTYAVVDYKTNQDIKPEIYYNQLACYRQAVSQMLNVEISKIQCILYYLRFNEAVDITEAADSIDLEKAISEI